MYQGFMLYQELLKARFIPSAENDHEHCIMCGIKFSANQSDMHVGYTTKDYCYWLCADCFSEYKKEYHWKLFEGD